MTYIRYAWPCTLLLVSCLATARSQINYLGKEVTIEGVDTNEVLWSAVIKLDMDRDLTTHDDATLPTSSADVQKVQAQARDGDPEAQFKLGVLYLTGKGGLERDYARALALLRAAADRGHQGATRWASCTSAGRACLRTAAKASAGCGSRAAPPPPSISRTCSSTI